MYDVMSTVGLSTWAGQNLDTTLGMWIGEATDVRHVGVGDVLDEANLWGLNEHTARNRVNEIIERLPDAIDDAASAVPSLPEERLETIRARARMLHDDPARR